MRILLLLVIIDDQTTGLSYFIFLKIVGLHIKPAYHLKMVSLAGSVKASL